MWSVRKLSNHFEDTRNHVSHSGFTFNTQSAMVFLRMRGQKLSRGSDTPLSELSIVWPWYSQRMCTIHSGITAAATIRIIKKAFDDYLMRNDQIKFRYQSFKFG